MCPCVLHQPATLFHPFLSPCSHFQVPMQCQAFLASLILPAFAFASLGCTVLIQTSLAIPPHIPSQPAPALMSPSTPATSPSIPPQVPSFLQPLPMFSTLPSHTHDEDWGQSIFQWGGEPGPAPFAHFLWCRTHSVSSLPYIHPFSTFQLSACSAHPVLPLPCSPRLFQLSACVLQPACCPFPCCHPPFVPAHSNIAQHSTFLTCLLSPSASHISTHALIGGLFPHLPLSCCLIQRHS